MKRQKNDSKICMVYAYGCVPPIEQKLPGHLAEMTAKNDYSHVVIEVEKQRAMWDALVAMDRAHAETIDNYMISRSQDYAKAVESYRRTNDIVESLLKKKNPHPGDSTDDFIHKMNPHPGDSTDDDKYRNNNPHPGDSTDDTTGSFKQAVAVRNLARSAMWAEAKKWRKENPGMYKMFDALRREKIKEIRQQSGLYWGNYNRVLDDYDATRKRCMKSGKKLRFADWSKDNGCLTVQVQRTSSGLGASPMELMDGTFSQLQIGMVPDGVEKLPAGKRARACKTLVEMRVDSEGHMIRCPVWIHRPMPGNARIKRAQLIWRKEGARIIGRLCLTLTMAAPANQNRKKGRMCAMNFGWSPMPDGSLRVATVSPVGSGKEFDITLPSRWMTGMDQVERLGQYIHRDLVEIASYIKQQEDDIKSKAMPNMLCEIVSKFTTTGAYSGFRSVSAQKLHDAVRFLEYKVPEMVVAWYKRYRHLSVWRDNLRAKLIRRRREEYRIACKKLAIEFSTIDLAESDLIGKTADLKNRNRAGISVFKTELQNQAVKHGSEIRTAACESKAAAKQKAA